MESQPLPGHTCFPPTSQAATFHPPRTSSEEASSSPAVIKYPRQQLAMSSAKQILYYSTMKTLFTKRLYPEGIL